MKFRSKLQFFSLFLAMVICGQELIHVAFHSHAAPLPGLYRQQASGKFKLSDPARGHSDPDIHIKAACPVCSSPGGKSIPEIDLYHQFISHAALSCPGPNKLFTFTFFNRPLSRGPPAA
ncbi:MAG: hypothetical protein PHV82_14190 [Victivallaceae bacterium]|nr:hypothetical protein [Victivallaceae bacterium]